jgi:hypothetical protein
MKQFAKLHIQTENWKIMSITVGVTGILPPVQRSIYKCVHICIFSGASDSLQKYQSWIGIIITVTMERTITQHIQRSALKNNEYRGREKHLGVLPMLRGGQHLLRS